MNDKKENKSKFTKMVEYTLSLINDVLKERRFGTDRFQTAKKTEIKGRVRGPELRDVN